MRNLGYADLHPKENNGQTPPWKFRVTLYQAGDDLVFDVMKIPPNYNPDGWNPGQPEDLGAIVMKKGFTTFLLGEAQKVEKELAELRTRLFTTQHLDNLESRLAVAQEKWGPYEQLERLQKMKVEIEKQIGEATKELEAVQTATRLAK